MKQQRIFYLLLLIAMPIPGYTLDLKHLEFLDQLKSFGKKVVELGKDSSTLGGAALSFASKHPRIAALALMSSSFVSSALSSIFSWNQYHKQNNLLEKNLKMLQKQEELMQLQKELAQNQYNQLPKDPSFLVQGPSQKKDFPKAFSGKKHLIPPMSSAITKENWMDKPLHIHTLEDEDQEMLNLKREYGMWLNDLAVLSKEKPKKGAKQETLLASEKTIEKIEAHIAEIGEKINTLLPGWLHKRIEKEKSIQSLQKEHEELAKESDSAHISANDKRVAQTNMRTLQDQMQALKPLWLSKNIGNEIPALYADQAMIELELTHKDALGLSAQDIRKRTEQIELLKKKIKELNIVQTQPLVEKIQKNTTAEKKKEMYELQAAYDTLMQELQYKHALNLSAQDINQKKNQIKMLQDKIKIINPAWLENKKQKESKLKELENMYDSLNTQHIDIENDHSHPIQEQIQKENILKLNPLWFINKENKEFEDLETQSKQPE